MSTTNSKRATLTVVVVTLNEETHIRACLESVKWADEIIVYDSLSTDRTVEIAREYTSHIQQMAYLGGGPMRNKAIDEATGEWIFTIDADERVSDELKEEIQRVLAAPQVDAYDVPRRSYFLGRWIKHCGWWPDYVLRLFRKSTGRYDERWAHAKVVTQGTVGKLQSPLEHYSYENLSGYVEKINHRTSLMAREKHRKGSVVGGCVHMITKFFRSYIWQRGFLDGKEGLLLSVLASYYVFLKYVKAWEANRGK